MNFCKECGKSTTNPKFCSKSCSATYNNRGRVRTYKSENYICTCGKRKHHKAKMCHNCKKWHTLNVQNERTLEDISSKGNARVKWSHLRQLARKMMELHGVEKKCRYCEFNQVVHVCHIKDISEFDLTAKVKIVNSIDNLIYLCPNHHAMLDLGLLHIDEIEGEERNSPCSIR